MSDDYNPRLLSLVTIKYFAENLSELGLTIRNLKNMYLSNEYANNFHFQPIFFLSYVPSYLMSTILVVI